MFSKETIITTLHPQEPPVRLPCARNIARKRDFCSFHDMNDVVQIRKIFVVAIVGAALILIWAFFIRHIGIEYRLEATAELTKIVTVSDGALSTMDDEISAFAKKNNFRLAMRGGFQKYQLLAELTRDDVNLMVTNPFPDPHEVHLAAYRVPNSQIAKAEMGALLDQLGCKVLASCE